MWMEINPALGKNRGHRPVVQAAGRLLWSASETKCWQLSKILKFNIFDPKARLSCLNDLWC